MISLRREFHRHPELSGEEKGTSARISEELTRLGISFRQGVAGYGIIADIPGPAGVPYLALRADMDALPVHEETELPFASVNRGCMHACAHDGHMSMLLGAAELLVRDDDRPAPVRLIFQPSEEKGSGAQDMIDAGALEGVGAIFGGHLDRHYLAGTIVVTEGIVNASTDGFRIEITGQGGHAARPHESIDAVVVGSLLVMALQTIVSREVNPAHPAVVTVGRFEAGTAFNVIAGQALLEGTIRAQEREVRDRLKRSLRRMCESVGQLHGAGVAVTFVEGTPSLHNAPPMVGLARLAAEMVVGKDNIDQMRVANMGGEDFANYVEKVPGCYVRFGAQVKGRESYPAHSSKFDFDENALEVGAAYYHAVARVAGRWLHDRAGAMSHDHGPRSN
jgi:hippurate hydrolase